MIIGPKFQTTNTQPNPGSIFFKIQSLHHWLRGKAPTKKNEVISHKKNEVNWINPF